MSTPAPTLPEDVARLIEQKKFAEIEDLWTRRMEAEPRNLPFFFGVAVAVKKKGGAEMAVSWLRFLADYHAEAKDLDSRLDVLAEIARMTPTDAAVRGELEETLRVRYASHPALAAVLQQNPLAGARDPAAVAGKIRRWLSFLPGEVYYLTGRGAARIVEMNPALDVLRLELGSTKLPLSLVSAEKSLVLLSAGHFLRRKVEEPEALRALAEESPADVVRLLLESFGRALSVAEVKEHVVGVIPEARWPAFWSAARKNPRLLVSGSGKNAAVSWTASAGDAEQALRAQFFAADPARKMELARQNARRSAGLQADFARGLAEEALLAGEGNPGLAWELSQAAARILPGEPEAFPAERLLASSDLSRVLAGIRDHVAREKALEAIRGRRPDALEIFADQFLREEDARVLEALWGWLAENEPKRQEVARRTLRSPRVAPRAFLWLCERVRHGELPAPPGLFLALLDALRQEEFSGHRSRVKELFEPGNLAVMLARGAASEEEGREYLAALLRAGGLEEHRRALVREAILMRFPALRAPARENLYATPEAIEARRKELEHLKQVELPANAEAMRVAKEHGDLSENFEYQAARQRHEYISARIATLADELSRTRALDASRVDASEVRVGTSVRLREEGNGAEREVTILGPWDSRPEESIYSYQSEFAQRLLGAKPGDRVALPGGEAFVVSIVPWKKKGAN